MIEKHIKAVVKEQDSIKGVVHFENMRGPNGLSAYEIYVANLPEGEAPLSEQEWLNSLNKANYYKQYKDTYTVLEDNTTTIPINIPQYNSTTLLDVYINGLRLNENEYTINDTNIILTLPVSKGTEIHKVVSKTVVATPNDYDFLAGDDGVSITTATAGTSIDSEGYTITPIIFSKSDNSNVTVNVSAKNGVNGSGVPDGGTTGQFLAKASDSNQDVTWKTLTLNVIDNLNSTSSTNPLSANMGKKLNDNFGYEVIQGDHGTAIKYNDGRLECYGTVNSTKVNSGAWGPYYFKEKYITFPKEFIEPPTVVANAYGDEGMYFVSLGSNESLTTKQCTIRLMSVQKIIATDFWFTYHAYGRWKE